MIFGKWFIKHSMGFFTYTDMPELKYGTYKPNAVDKVFFQISRLMFWAFWLSLIILIPTGKFYQPDFVYFDFFGYFDINYINMSAITSYGCFMLYFLILIATVPGLPLSVYLCSLTGYKSLKIDIGLRLIIIFVTLCFLIPTAIQCLIAYINLF